MGWVAAEPPELEPSAKEIEAVDRAAFTAKIDIRDEVAFA